MSEIKIQHDDLGELVFRRPRWADFAAWWDTRESERLADAQNNLAIACALRPSPAELSDIFEDGYGFLPVTISNYLLDFIGAPENGFGAPYPVIVRANLDDAGKERYDALCARVKGSLKKRTAERVAIVDVLGVWWALRPPGANAAAAYADSTTGFARGKADASFAEASRSLVLACALAPDAETAKAQIDENPHIAYVLPEIVRELGGFGSKKVRLAP